MQTQEKIYEKIKRLQLKHGVTIAIISKQTGLSKQTVSYRILNIKKRGIVDIKFIESMEKIFGEKIFKI